MNIIFLDFEGVIDTASYDTYLSKNGMPECDEMGRPFFDPLCIINLQHLVDATDSKIVITSDWKYADSFEELSEMWQERNMPGSVIGITPNVNNLQRGDEIACWLKECVNNCSYVIIDDLNKNNFNHNQLNKLVIVNPSYGLDEKAVKQAKKILYRQTKPKWYNFMHRHKMLCFIVMLILLKIGWVAWSCWNNGSFDDEKMELLQRRNYLIEKIVVDPQQLLNEMPSNIGSQFQGEWALYSCSMLAEALANMASLYPETKDDAVATIDSLIQIVKSTDLRLYDKIRWMEDPLESLDGDQSHVSYLSHLAWMIGNYRKIGGDSRYNMLHDSICEAMNHRILQSPILNIPTYPYEPVYVPDMLVAIVALSEYARLNNGEYSSTVKTWINRAKTEWIDENTGLLVSFLNENGKMKAPIKGSYSALNCYYLTKIDAAFAKEQYERLKSHFRQGFPAPGLKEFHDRSCWFGMDIDAGPILMNLSASGTAFAIGAATYFNDKSFRNSLLRTAETVGHTVKWNDKRHYSLGSVVLVGEAITLAMRTNHSRPDSI